MIKQLGLQGNNFPASYGMTDTMGQLHSNFKANK